MNKKDAMDKVDKFLDGYRQYNSRTGETIIPYKYGEGQRFVYKDDYEAIQELLDVCKRHDNYIKENKIYKNNLYTSYQEIENKLNKIKKILEG